MLVAERGCGVPAPISAKQLCVQVGVYYMHILQCSSEGAAALKVIS